MNTNPMLTPREVAERLSISTLTLQAWRNKGTGPDYVKAGAAVRYPESAVDEWIEAQTVRATS